MKQQRNQGFTIIELLIAIVTFSLVLLIITGAIIQFSQIYYKGVVTSKTQETARAIMEEMTRAAQFSTTADLTQAASPLAPGVYCFGDNRFRYDLNNTANIGLMAVQSKSCNTTPVGDERQLLGDNMRLLKLDAVNTVGGITITVSVGYGDDITAAGTCPAIAIGGQFCAVSTITSTVTRRL